MTNKEKKFIINDGVLLDYRGYEHYVEVPEGVTSIEENAFRRCSLHIVSLTLPKSLRTVNGWTGRELNALRKLLVLSEEIEVGEAAFMSCRCLEEVVFRSKKGSFGQSSFFNCPELKTVVLPDEITGWGENAFGKGKKIRTLYENGLHYIGSGENPYLVLFGAREDVAFLSVHGRTRVVASRACVEHTHLQNADLKHVRVIGGQAFRRCEGLSVVFMPEVRVVEKNAFEFCRSLREVRFTSTLECVRLGAFNMCDKLLKAEFEGATNAVLEEAVFSACRSLRTVTFTAIPKRIDERTFVGCSNINWTRNGRCSYLGDRENPHRILFGNDKASKGEVEIDPHTEMIADNAFREADGNFSRLVVPGSVKRIGERAFCESPLEYLEIREGVEELDAGCFSRCWRLREVILPDKLKRVGAWALSHCTNGEKLLLNGSVGVLEKGAFFNNRMCPGLWFDAIEYSPERVRSAYDWLSGNRTPWDGPAIAKYVSRERRNVLKYIVEQGNAKAFDALVEQIGDKEISLESLDECLKMAEGKAETAAFLLAYKDKHYPEERLERIERIKTEKAFGERPMTKQEWSDTFELSALDNVYFITKYKKKEENVLIPGKIGRKTVAVADRAFRGCKELRGVEIGEGVCSIGRKAFEGCDNLESVVLPDSVRAVGRYAFSHCKNLAGVVVGQGVKELPEGAFYACKNVKCVEIGEGVERIAPRCFFYNENLERINLPSTLSSIGEYAFDLCDKVTMSVSPGTFGEEYVKMTGKPFRYE